MKSNPILQIASMILQERALEQKLQNLRSKRRAAGKGYSSSGLGHSPDRTDLTVNVGLAEYLTAFADKEITPKAQSYPSDHFETIGGESVVTASGVKHYMSYPAQFVGTLPTKPPTHVWATATTDSAWAQGDPKPLANEQSKAA